MDPHGGAVPRHGHGTGDDGTGSTSLPAAVGDHDGGDDVPVGGTGGHRLGTVDRPAVGGAARAARITQFAAGYLLSWTAFGLAAYGALSVIGSLVDGHPGAGRWLGAAAFLLAGLYQLGPLKRVCLLHCRNPLAHLVRYARFRPWARDLRVGAHHGLYCVGCCWGLMIVLVPLGVMNLAAMAGLAAVIFLEKLWRWGPWLTWAVGIVFLVLAVIAPFQDGLLPGLQMSGPSM